MRLKEARQHVGLSQKELGLRIGLEPGSASSRMNHYEKGRHMPDYETLEKMAKELDVPVAYFFCDNKLSAEIVKLLQKMSEEDKKALLETLKSEMK